MSAIFFAAGPDIRSGSLTHVHNIDVAPTVAQILGVKLFHACRGERYAKLASLVQGKALAVSIPCDVKAASSNASAKPIPMGG